MTRWAFIALLTIQHLPSGAQGACFDDLVSSYALSTQPLESDALGYWGGNCVLKDEPQAYWPGVLIVKKKMLAAGEATTLTYHWERRISRDTFRDMTPSQIEAEPSVKDWLAKEQWNPISVVNKSLSNEFVIDGSNKMRRELRTNKHGGTTRMVLRVIHVSPTGESPTLHCEFEKHLGRSTPPSRSTDKGYVFGSVPTSGIRTHEFFNPYPTRDIYRVQILNDGLFGISIGDVVVQLDDGTLAPGPRSMRLPARTAIELTGSARGPARIDRIRLKTWGTTSNLEIRAFETPKVP